VVEPIDSKLVGIDSSKKTLSLGSANGALVQITSQEVRIIPTLRFSAHQINKTSISQQQGQLSTTPIKTNNQIKQPVQQNINEKQWEMRSEFVGFDVKHGLSWPSPMVLPEELCVQRIQNLQSASQITQVNKIQNQSTSSSNLSFQSRLQEKVIFECACISDNLIAVSYKCIVFVLIWNPSKPKITKNKVDNVQQSPHQPQMQQLPALILPVATLCFPSPVVSLAASMICTRSFLVVGCEYPPAIFLFRLDTIQVAQQSEIQRKKLWINCEKLLKGMKYQIAYPTAQQPDLQLIIQNGIMNETDSVYEQSHHQIRIGKGNQCAILGNESCRSLTRGLNKDAQTVNQIRFIEVLPNSHQFVAVQYSTSGTMTRMFDLYLNDIPSQILLTTFKKQVHIYTQSEIEATDLNPNVGLSPLAQVAVTQYSDEKEKFIQQQNYKKNDGVVLLIAGQSGQLATSIIPLTVLIDFPPNQLQNNEMNSQATFFFPSLVTTLKQSPQPIKLIEDEGIVYIYGDRVSAMTWSDRACKILWTDLESMGVIHSLVPMRVVEESLLPFAKDQEKTDENDNKSEKISMISTKDNNTDKSEIQHPSLCWIDNIEKKLIFGTIDKRRILTRSVKDLPSLPLAISHIPNLHAIAVLCREHSQNQFNNSGQYEQQGIDKDYFFNEKDKAPNDRNFKDLHDNQNITYENSKTLDGLGIDISGIIGTGNMHMPYHELYINYLQQREKEKNNIRIFDHKQSRSDISLQTGDNQKHEEQKLLIQGKDTKIYQLSNQYFHQSIPDKDFKGDPFNDIAIDWCIESHSKHFKDYRPKRIIPYKCNTPKISFDYSPQTNFSIAYPHWLSPFNIIKALKNQDLRQSEMMKETQFVDDIQQDQDLDIEIEDDLPLPPVNQQSQFFSQLQSSSSSISSISNTKLIDTLKSNEKKLEQSSKSFEQFVKTVNNSYMIILYDETEMHLRIGQLNLSQLKLDFGVSINDLDRTFQKSSFTFFVNLVALIICPSPITSFTLDQTLHRPLPASLPHSIVSKTALNEQTTFRGLTINHKISNLVPSYISYPQFARALVVCAPCCFAFVDIKFTSYSPFKSIIAMEQRRICAFNPQDDSQPVIQNFPQDYLTDIVEPQLTANDQLKTPMKLPPTSRTDLASAAGIFLKHDPNDLVKTGVIFGQKIALIAQAYAPTLIIDSQYLGFNQFGLLCENEILLYSLLPNPLYKKTKKQQLSNYESKIINDFECLPMCAALTVRCPAQRHFSFIFRSSSGINSFFGGTRNNLIRQMDKVVKYLKTHFNNSVQPQQDPLKQLTSPMEAESLDIIEEEKEDIQTIENYEEEEILHAEDLDDPYYWNLSKEQKSPIESILSSSKGTLQHLPPVPTFIVFSRSGAITRAIPLYYDLIPLKDVFFEVHRYDLLSQYFGDKWRSQQTQISQDYWKLSEQVIRISAGEQCLREWTALWKVLRRPPAPLSNLMPPLQALKDGRFIQSQAMFGLSPLPITAEYTNWRSLTEQQTLYAIQRMQFQRKQLAQTRLITREFFRRYQKNYQSMKELEQTPGVIVEKNKEILIMRAVFSSIQLIGRPMQMLQSDIPDDEAKEMYYLFKQAHTALRQFQLTVLDQMVKYQKFEESPIMRHVYPHFMQSIDQQLNLSDQYWIKYRDFIIKDNIGLRSNIDIRPKDDPQITGFLTKGLAQAPIKLSKKNRVNSSEYSLDLISISEKLHFNRVHLQNDGKDLKLNIRPKKYIRRFIWIKLKKNQVLRMKIRL
ncbi:MAG: hypothetical protein EZS28_018927, partial [Streblomastix strix]